MTVDLPPPDGPDGQDDFDRPGDSGRRGADDPGSREDNGLFATRYVPLTDVPAALGDHLLAALRRGRIAAYLAESPDSAGPDAARRLHVDADERADARTIVAAVLRAAGAPAPPSDVPPPAPRADPLAGVDTDARFADLIADWHVDTVAAIRQAERDLSREDAEWRARLRPPTQEPTWLDEQHFVPPPPPPLPRLTAPTVIAMLLVAMAVVLLGFGGALGLPYPVALTGGVACVLVSTGLLVARLRDRHDEDDDGAVV